RSGAVENFSIQKQAAGRVASVARSTGKTVQVCEASAVGFDAEQSAAPSMSAVRCRAVERVAEQKHSRHGIRSVAVGERSACPRRKAVEIGEVAPVGFDSEYGAIAEGAALINGSVKSVSRQKQFSARSRSVAVGAGVRTRECGEVVEVRDASGREIELEHNPLSRCAAVGSRAKERVIAHREASRGISTILV